MQIDNRVEHVIHQKIEQAAFYLHITIVVWTLPMYGLQRFPENLVILLA